MTSMVIPFERPRHHRAVPPLVFVEMNEEHLHESPNGVHDLAATLVNCRSLLRRARLEGWPVAFVTPFGRMRDRSRAGLRWIDGFTPQRSDMIFEPAAASCYSSEEFAEAMTAAGMQFVLAGFSAESVCLATLIDAFTYGHYAGLIRDASSSRPLPGHDAVECHHAVVATASRYGAVLTTERWLRVAQSPLSELELCGDIN